jgi:hypothetical protein
MEEAENLALDQIAIVPQYCGARSWSWAGRDL